MEAQLEKALSEHPTHDRMALLEERIMRGIAESKARTARHINQSVGIILGTVLAGLALAVGIILGFG